MCRDLFYGPTYVLSWWMFHMNLKVYSAVVSMKSSWFIVLFRYSLSLLIFCLVFLSIIEIEILKSPSIIVELSFPFLDSVSFCFVYFEVSVVMYIYNSYIFLMDWPSYYCIMFFFVYHSIFVLKSIWSDVSIYTLALLWFLFIWNIFLCPFIFNLNLNLK